MSQDPDIETQAQAAIQIQSNFEKNVLQTKVNSMKEELGLFSRTQDPKHFRNAIQVRNQLENEDHQQPDLVVDTKELFAKGFTFENVAQYDHVVAQLTEVQNAQDNLNNNQDNDTLMD